MAGLRRVIIVAVVMALIFAVTGSKNQRLHARQDSESRGYQHHGEKPCTDNPQLNPYMPPCPTIPPIPDTSTTPVTEAASEEETSAESTTNTPSPSSLERAHWCRFSNGTNIPLGFTYMQNRCLMCNCTASRAIACQIIKCMPTYCIDNATPIRKSDQCCTQCPNDVSKADSCVYKGVSYPHGAVMKMVEYKMQCWCQLGEIECRQYMGSLFQGFDIFSDTKTIYMIGMLMLVVLFVGLLVCCGCSLFLYRYIQQNQYAIQQAYDEYVGTGGWQPVTEEEPYAVDAAEEKHLEAQKHAFENYVNEGVPPPYAIHDGSTNEQKKRLFMN